MNTGKDLTGQVRGYLTAVERVGQSTSKGVQWVVLCRCGTRLHMAAAEFCRKPKRQGAAPRSCGCYKKENRSSRYKGVGDLSSTRWLRTKKHAARKGLAMEITIEYAWGLFVKQNKRCALSNVLLKMSPSSMAAGATTASLERIDGTKGYIVGNVQWVHLELNDMKSNHREKDFIRWCRLVAYHNSMKAVR